MGITYHSECTANIDHFGGNMRVTSTWVKTIWLQLTYSFSRYKYLVHVHSVPTQDVTNPVSDSSSYCMSDIPFLFDSMLILHFSKDQSN